MVPHGVAGTWPRLGFRAGDRTSTSGALKEKQKVHRFKRQKFARLLRWSLIASATHSPIHVTGSPPLFLGIVPSALNSHNCAACLLRARSPSCLGSGCRVRTKNGALGPNFRHNFGMPEFWSNWSNPSKPHQNQKKPTAGGWEVLK